MKKRDIIKKKYIDLKLVLLLAGFYALFDLVMIAKTAYMKAFGMEFKENFSWWRFLLDNLLFDYIIVVSFMTLIAISTKRFLRKNYSWTKIIFTHILFSLLIGIVIRLVVDFYFIILGDLTFAQYDIERSIYRFMYVIDLNFLIYFAMVFIIYTYYYVKEVKKAENVQSKLEAQLVKERMKMLASQLQPHFLFNTLNSISVLTDIDAGKAKDTIADLSDFLREILYDNNNLIPLEKELRILEFYLNIIKVRFSDHLKITMEIDNLLLHKKVPSLLLQPIIENSIKHGYDINHINLDILVNIYSEGQAIIIKIENNGALVKVNHELLLKSGMGLSNIKDRLENLYNENFFFKIQNKSDGLGVETIIKIPFVN
ncbi:sensor histidine kinase [Aequorivita xiaoshiensis]|uniref:Histidine kinase n=1 Tax=Aequorivita xiaoshiensis TaxID=2874476 RepID=A0A9X1U5I2_9FLAO|nr:histidine kinase [Aequorivita xiaoshiensis]MCG2432045.1 histidine kinase [Aequorivita xiaoshiensis]